MKHLTLALAVVLLTFTTSSASADCVDGYWWQCEQQLIDNLEPLGSGRHQIGGGTSSAFPNRGVGQSFYSYHNARISRIQVMMRRIDLPRYNLIFRLHEVNQWGSISNDPIFEDDLLRWFVPSSFSSGWPAEFDFRNSSDELLIEQDKQYYFSIFAAEGDISPQFEVAYNPDSDSYADGSRYQHWRTDGNWAFQSSGDLNFRMFAVVPEPATGLLLLPIGMMLVCRRNRNRR